MSQRYDMTNTKDGDMNREQIVADLGLKMLASPVDVADYIISHTSELRKENERLKVIEADEEVWLEKLSIEQDRAYNLEKENEELKAKLKTARTCEFCGSTDLVCGKGWKEERDALLAKNTRLKELVDGIKKALSISRNSVHDGRREALAKIAEYKESK